MLGYMNKDSLQQACDTGRVTFYSRTKQRLWVKGETSGNYLSVVDVLVDCDGDTLWDRRNLRVFVIPACFWRESSQNKIFYQLFTYFFVTFI